MTKLKVKTKLLVLFLMMLGSNTLSAQQKGTNLQMIDFTEEEFKPHWEIGVQAGAAADLGEAELGHLISPALQITGEYRFHKLFGIRGSVSGLWARNRYVFPSEGYKWNFIQPAVEFKLDLASLIVGWVHDQPVSPYIFGGVGAAFSFGNDDAERAKQKFAGITKDYEFKKIWNSRWNPVIRGGLGADIYLNDYLSLNAEVNANMMPDHFNSKRGKHDNRDWHFNALLGLKVNLGKTYRGGEPVYRSVRTMREPVVRDTVIKIVNIFFLINSSELRSSEFGKLYELINYLNANPKAHIEMTGYADRLTGTPMINERLSRERAAAVANWLITRGVSRERVYTDAKGDRVQPFPINEENRVTICYVVDLLQ